MASRRLAASLLRSSLHRLPSRSPFTHATRSARALSQSNPTTNSLFDRIINVIGEPIDHRGEIKTDHYLPIHREAPSFVDQATEQQILVTGIKVVDLLAPYQRGGKIGLFGGAGVGKTVSRQNSRLKSVKNLFPCSYHTSLTFGSSAASPHRAFNNQEHKIQYPTCSIMLSRALYSTDAAMEAVGPTEAAKELHDKLIKSVTEQRTAPPNNMLWSLIEKCQNREDIKLLYNVLENLRKFRLSNLRIFENFNDHLCREVSKACVRAEAIDLGKKTLWKRNVYGLTPSVASAHNILLYAKQHNDVNLMVDVLKLLKTNDVALQPGTADIVFSICYNTDSWELLCKYAKRFVKSGVKLRRTSFDTWMTYAAKIGDVDGLWKIEKLRTGLMKTHTIGSGFSCAKGLLLERKPKEAAAVIQVVTQTLPEAKRADIMAELEKLVSEWPLEVIKSKKDEDKIALAAGLQEDIPAMIDSLSGLAVKDLKMDDLTNLSF